MKVTLLPVTFITSMIMARASGNNDVEVSSNALTNQIMCGYQGWYAFPGDGAPINRWKHWFKNPANIARPGIPSLGTDMYPTMDEYDDEDLKESGIRMSDGSFAKFFSSVKPGVVLKHFEWMATYGITGVFHHRFMQDLDLPKNREWKTMVLRNVKNAAERTGRAFAVSYDIAGSKITNDSLEDLKADWMRLVDEERITRSSRYIRQNGRPVLHIFGIGLKTVNIDDTQKLAHLINWFQRKAPYKYRVFLVGGVPSKWRERIGDSREEPAWRGIYDSLDGIHSWHVGRWTTVDNFNSYMENVIEKDAAYCESRGILYMPTMWAGFSWHNLKNQQMPLNHIPRLGGEFMWSQAHKYASNRNIKSIWMAQFDETDEGTAIYKVAARTADLPAQGNWLALDSDGHDLPSDWYLRLAGEAQRMLEGKRALTRTIPLDPADAPPPMKQPAIKPTRRPTKKPTIKPTRRPTRKPTQYPTRYPTRHPTKAPKAIAAKNVKPTDHPTRKPSKRPTSSPVITFVDICKEKRKVRHCRREWRTCRWERSSRSCVVDLARAAKYKW